LIVVAMTGKFKTILYLSFVYVAGSIVLSVTSIPGATGDPPHWWGAAVGLALGTLDVLCASFASYVSCVHVVFALIDVMARLRHSLAGHGRHQALRLLVRR
jgi:uncharacterized membrane protein YhiD involved in acid resistance